MKPIFVSFASLLLLSLTTAPAHAKDCTIGIYAIVHRVTFEPDSTSPKVIRIAGEFVVPISTSTCGYQAPQRGYLYFRIRPGAERETRAEWNTLKTLAGTGRVVGFAYYWVPNPNDPEGNPHTSLEVKIHDSNDGASPSAYPLPNRRGVVERGDKADPRFSRIAQQLKTVSTH